LQQPGKAEKPSNLRLLRILKSEVGIMVRAIACASLLLASITAVANAQSPSNQQITLVVGFGVGGTYDLHARTLARHWPDHLDGKPNFTIRNMPGAGSLVAANFIYNTAPKDGSHVALVSRSIPTLPLFNDNGVRFNPLSLNWIGSTASETALLFSRIDSKATRFEDLREHSISIPTSGAGADSAIFANALNRMLGTKINIVSGYKGSGHFLLAFEQGEVDGIMGLSYNALKSTRPQWLSEKRISILLQLSTTKDAELKEVPIVGDFARNEVDADAIRMIFSGQALAFPFVAPPGVPEAEIKRLQKSFAATVSSPGYLADASRQNLVITPATGAEILESIKKSYSAPKHVIERAREAFRVEKK